MGKFCTKCGRPLAEGEVCGCVLSRQAAQNNRPVSSGPAAENIITSEAAKPFTSNRSFDLPVQIDTAAAKEALGGVIKDFTQRSGLAAAEDSNVYEDGLAIVPDVIQAQPGEVLLQQYEIARLHSRLLGFPYAKGKARLAVTNKRIIFRAAGKNIRGSNAVHQEFNIQDIKGIETKQEHAFRFSALLFAVLLVWIGSFIPFILFMKSDLNTRIVVGFLFGLACLIPYFLLKDRWKTKLFCLGMSGSFFTLASSPLSGGPGMQMFARMFEYASLNGFQNFLLSMSLFLGLAAGILILVTELIYAIQPNLLLRFKTRTGEDAVVIQRNKSSFSKTGADSCGYSEVYPSKDFKKVVKDLGALISAQQN